MVESRTRIWLPDPSGGGDDVFAHITAVADECDDPVEGNLVEYELGVGKDGRPKAVEVVVLTKPAPSNLTRDKPAEQKLPWEEA